jgi:hypothetical protein
LEVRFVALDAQQFGLIDLLAEADDAPIDDGGLADKDAAEAVGLHELGGPGRFAGSAAEA